MVCCAVAGVRCCVLNTVLMVVGWARDQQLQQQEGQSVNHIVPGVDVLMREWGNMLLG